MPQTIFDSYFLVSFRSDTIITWGKEKDMYQHHNEFIHIDLEISAPRIFSYQNQCPAP